MSDEEKNSNGEPSGEPGPSNPDESVPSEGDAAKDLPGVPEEADGELDDPPPAPA